MQNLNHSNIKINSLSHDGRGIAKIEDKTVFIKGAIPEDVVSIKNLEAGDKFDVAEVKNVFSPSPNRVEPFCQYYSQCGGCQLQHLSIDAQRDWKIKNFITRLSQAVNSKHLKIEPPIYGSDKGYRRRARFGLAISKKDKIARLGFRQPQSNELIDIEHCPVLTDAMNEALKTHRPSLLEQASRSYKEVNLVEATNGCYLHLDKQTDSNDASPQPEYNIDNLTLNFPVDGFVQVNAEINQQMVQLAINWLELDYKTKVLDLFCGVGNFTLPIAQQTKSVVGIEGLSELIETAQTNAAKNHGDNVEFFKADLFKETDKSSWFRKQKYHRVLLDPGRQGAFEISKKLHLVKPEIIVYVSCNAATLIRDIKELEKQGYILHKACLMDMFPHTTHTEVMVQLKKIKQTKKQDRKIFKF